MNTTLTSASSRILYDEAQKIGIKCTTFGDDEIIYMEKNGKSWYVRGSRTSLQSSVGKTIADLKPLTKKILLYNKIPTAKGVVIHHVEEIQRLSELTFPLVAKPIDERHGKGVVMSITDKGMAEKVYKNQHSDMLFEETLSGIEYRIICVNFKFIAAAFRKPAHVVGDGKHTISELIAEKNKHPWRGKGHINNLTLIECDEMLLVYIKKQGKDLQSIPKDGEEVLLRQTANLSTGGEAWDVSDQVCEENKRLFEKIATVCDLNTIGIDMMCTSISEPIVNQKHAGVIEVNASAGLRMHHFPIKGKAINVAGKILEMVLKEKHIQL